MLYCADGRDRGSGFDVSKVGRCMYFWYCELLLEEYTDGY